MASKGSWNSPIYVSDDEDEMDVAGQLTSPEFDATPPTTSPQHTHDQLTSASEPMHTPMETSFEPRSTLQKRKRDDAFSSSAPGPSRLRENHSRDVGPANLETKKARKRRRRLEREEAMAHSRAQAFVSPFTVLPFLPALNSWTPGPAFNPYSFAMPAQPLPPKPVLYHEQGGYPEPGGYISAPRDAYAQQAPQAYPPPHRYGSGPSHDHRHDWVSSMAATGTSDQGLDFWDAYPSAPPPMEPPPLPAPPPEPPALRPVTPVPSPVPPAIKPIVPTKKPISLIIGMNPDQDRHSKHGTFHHTTHTITSLPATPASHDTYIPNPARTIVMEQLPKTHRTRDFIKSWSKSACGAHPVYFAVDPPSAKALIEFATAELARKAWGSPKLGGGVAGPPIKGKPRADLIRVWWYRVDGVGAGAGVGEIEEGEIEGDAGEREVSVPPEKATKKETKKERKARLAREREAKMPKVQPETSATPSFASSEVSTPTAAPAEESVPEAPPYADIPAPDPYPFLPDSPPPAYSDPSPVWPVDPAWNDGVSGTASFGRPAPFRPPLPPQSALGTQWQARYPPTRRPEQANYSGSSGSTTAASSFPAEPPALSRLPVSFASEAQTDVDVDMELDTPASGSFPFSYSLPPTPVSEAPFSYALPPTPVSEVPAEPTPLPAPFLSSAAVAPLMVMPAPRPTPTPPPAPASSSPRASPALGTPPLEPRAMKNAPKGPSFVKRSLVARHKDLEERIARGKRELGITAERERELQAEDKGDAVSMEDNLRRLVLKSQKSKMRPPGVTVETAYAESTATGSSAVVSLLSAPPSPPPPPPVPVPAQASVPVPATAGFSLDELAVSFITETIQTLSAPAPPPPAAVKPPSQASTNNAALKLELAAKQKRLEEHIAESKTLMAQLTGARSKQEKERILGVMRERSRMMEEETTAAATPTTQTPTAMQKQTTTTSQSWKSGGEQEGQQQAPVVKLRWPESRNDVCVLIISDDEDEGSGEE